MCRICAAANSVQEGGDVVAKIDGAEYGGEHTDIGLPARHDDRLDLLLR